MIAILKQEHNQSIPRFFDFADNIEQVMLHIRDFVARQPSAPTVVWGMEYLGTDRAVAILLFRGGLTTRFFAHDRQLRVIEARVDISHRVGELFDCGPGR